MRIAAGIFSAKGRQKGSVLFCRFLLKNFVFFNIFIYLCIRKITIIKLKLCPENSESPVHQESIT